MITLPADALAALHILAYQLLAQHKTTKALPLFEFLVAHKPTDPKLRMTLAYALLRAGRAGDAVDMLSPLQFSSDPAVHFIRGKALAQACRPDEAQSAFAHYRQLRFRPATATQEAVAVPVTPTES